LPLLILEQNEFVVKFYLPNFICLSRFFFLADEFKPVLNNKLVIEGLQKIAKYFETEKHIGPKLVAEFLF
jgi:hypothetical protein